LEIWSPTQAVQVKSPSLRAVYLWLTAHSVIKGKACVAAIREICIADAIWNRGAPCFIVKGSRGPTSAVEAVGQVGGLGVGSGAGAAGVAVGGAGILGAGVGADAEGVHASRRGAAAEAGLALAVCRLLVVDVADCEAGTHNGFRGA
jgi:hypothetical protein